MSAIPIYDITNEPYYNYFIRNGYKYLGYGYMHIVFEKDNVVYKLVRSKFKKFDKKYDYEFERDNLDFLRKYGISTPKIIKIYDAGELVDDYIVLAEEKLKGIVKNEKTLNVQNVKEIISFQEKTHSHTMPFFGQLYDKNLQFGSWNEYLSYITERAQKASVLFQIPFNVNEIEKFFSAEYQYTDQSRYMILDPNEENFIFDEADKLVGVIDIDHPVGFDPLYELSVCLYAKKYIFEMMRNLKRDYFNNFIEVIKMYARIHSLADILFLYDKDKNLFKNEIETCAKNVDEFQAFLNDYK